MAQLYNSQLDAFELYYKFHDRPESSSHILNGPALPALGHAVAGSVGAAASNISTYPLALIITRLQSQRQLQKNTQSSHNQEYQSIQDAIEKIYANEGGVKGFYVGLASDTMKTIADSFLFFLAYNFLRQSRLNSAERKTKHLPVIEELSVGFLAGAFSKIWTTPIANVVTRKQTSSMLKTRTSQIPTSQGSVRFIAQQIYAEKGLSGFWSGYSASLVLTLNPSLTFFFYEALKRSLLPRSKRSDPSSQATFLIAAMSKALASSITYPFSLAKSRLQTSNSENTHESISLESKLQPNQKTSDNVLSTIVQIANQDGWGALYEGLGVEVMKGFFSHGITMIVKETAHKLVIQLYYAILKLLRRYPSPQQLADTATGQVSEKARVTAAIVQENTSRVAEEVGKRTQPVAGIISSGVNSLTDMGQEALDLMEEYMDDDD